MKIVIDENIPFGEEAFSHLGEVTVLPGRQINSESLRDATALIVRSVTPVNTELLAGTDIRFVGTATSGIDHINQAYLTQRNIGFADAAGSNANSVAEYVLTALVTVASRFKISLGGKSLGIVGVGRIGRLVAKKAQALGMTVILHDPPLARETGDTCYQSLDEVLQADCVTLHVPLIKEGIDTTIHLIGEEQLAHMSPSSVLINTSRGEVVDNFALLHAIENKHLQGAVLDVWEGEPSINWELANRVTIATPHIAGYSFDGKVNGTIMIYQAACRYFGVAPIWQAPVDYSQPSDSVNSIDAHDQELQALVFQLATRFYDLQGDDARMRSLFTLPSSERPAGFDQLRKEYPTRREFFTSPVGLQQASPTLVSGLADLGFSIYHVEK